MTTTEGQLGTCLHLLIAEQTAVLRSKRQHCCPALFAGARCQAHRQGSHRPPRREEETARAAQLVRDSCVLSLQQQTSSRRQSVGPMVCLGALRLVRVQSGLPRMAHSGRRMDRVLPQRVEGVEMNDSPGQMTARETVRTCQLNLAAVAWLMCSDWCASPTREVLVSVLLLLLALALALSLAVPRAVAQQTARQEELRMTRVLVRVLARVARKGWRKGHQSLHFEPDGD